MHCGPLLFSCTTGTMGRPKLNHAFLLQSLVAADDSLMEAVQFAVHIQSSEIPVETRLRLRNDCRVGHGEGVAG